jgi:hypothetical protein
MGKFLALVVLLLSSLVTAFGADKSPSGHTKLDGVYRIYGGGLGDPVAPTAKDKKIMFSLEGKAAKDMFESMGPDVKDACTGESGDRVRKKDDGNLFCSKTEAGEYFCNFGFDLRTGKSIGGIVC